VVEQKPEGAVIDKKETEEEDPADVNLSAKPELHYNIQIHLPESRDPAVYEALFKSLKKHLF
jgi:hypothetical protein